MDESVVVGSTGLISVVPSNRIPTALPWHTAAKAPSEIFFLPRSSLSIVLILPTTKPSLLIIGSVDNRK
jgi:hypothetical protein